MKLVEGGAGLAGGLNTLCQSSGGGGVTSLRVAIPIMPGRRRRELCGRWRGTIGFGPRGREGGAGLAPLSSVRRGLRGILSRAGGRKLPPVN